MGCMTSPGSASKRVSERLLRFADRIAYGRPSWSDVIVSVWRPVDADAASS